jgi:hypothetical protein
MGAFGRCAGAPAVVPVVTMRTSKIHPRDDRRGARTINNNPTPDAFTTLGEHSAHVLRERGTHDP